MIDKVVGSVREAMSEVPDGASIAVGGFGFTGRPEELINELSERDLHDLHLIANSLPDGAMQRLGVERRLRKFTGAFVFSGALRDEVLGGRVEVEVAPQGTLSERLRAGGAGIAAFFTATSTGTLLETGGFPKRFSEDGEVLETSTPKEVREFKGRKYVLEYGLRPDYGLVRAHKADRMGNLVFRLSARNFNPLVAMAARRTIVQAEQIVEPGELDPSEVHLPGAFVDVVVEVPRVEQGDVRSARRRAQDSADTTDVVGYTREGIAKCIAEDLQQGWVVNLGAGMPVLVARYIPPGRGITLHMENGILGCGPPPPDEERDQDLSNAGGEYATLELGAAIFDSAMSFSIVRGGYLDVTVLGGLEVAANGDLANWYLPGGSTGVGGAMDLVQGAKAVWIAMEHTTRKGEPKILNECSYILTGPNVVKRIYTNLGSFSLEGGGLELIGLAPGITVDYVRERTEPSFTVKHGVG